MRAWQIEAIFSVAGCFMLFSTASCDDQFASPPTRSAIQSGTVAATCQWPAVVKIDDLCSGVLLGPSLVAFAGHCGLNARTATAVLGGAEDSRGIISCASQYGADPDRDLAVCQLDQPFSVPLASMLPLCLTPPSWIGQPVTLVGFGLDRPAGEFGQKKFLTGVITSESPSEFVVRLDDGGTCMGDSGGPAYTAINGIWYAIGIITKGDASICDVSEVYVTPLRQFATWIEAETHRRASPCDLDGTWSPGPLCGLSATDVVVAGATCYADMTPPEPTSPCVAFPLPRAPSMDTTLNFIRTPTGALAAASGEDIHIGVEILPADAIPEVQLSVSSPAALTWSQAFEFPPYQFSAPAVTGVWTVHVRARTLLGEWRTDEWSFTMKARGEGDGCSIAGEPLSGVETCLVALIVLSLIPRRRRP